MPYCLYCGKEKAREELTQEHFLPRTIGGNLDTYNPFSINNVCDRCNNLAGLFVDAPFTKSWFINNQRADNAKRYGNITPTSILPLKYFGTLDNIKFGEYVCEFWLGPTGDCIYHFHKQWPDESATRSIAGWPIGKIRNSIDKGFVFLSLRSNNPQWYTAVIYSVMEQFKGATMYPVNFKIEPGQGFEIVPDNLNDLLGKIMSLNGQSHNGKIAISIDYGVRFLCKLGLGFGYITFGEDFVLSEGAETLRAGMWSKTLADRNKVELHGTPFLSQGNNLSELKELLDWKGGHTFLLFPFGEGLGLYTSFYGDQSAVIQIKYPTNSIKEAFAFVVAPTLQKCVGPVTIGKYIAHVATKDRKHPLLTELDQMIEKNTGWPPYNI